MKNECIDNIIRKFGHEDENTIHFLEALDRIEILGSGFVAWLYKILMEKEVM